MTEKGRMSTLEKGFFHRKFIIIPLSHPIDEKIEADEKKSHP